MCILLEASYSILGNQLFQSIIISTVIVQRVLGGVIDACFRLPHDIICFNGVGKVFHPERTSLFDVLRDGDV